MRLYITVWETATSDREYLFSGTQAEQRAIVRSIKDEGDSLVRSEEIEVPTDKAGLLAFLNTYRVRPDLDEDYEAPAPTPVQRFFNAMKEEGTLL